MTDDIDDLRQRVDALAGGLSHAHERIDELETELAELQQVVDTDPERREYSELTPEQKTYKIREHLAIRAAETNGKARMGYREVKALFDGQPSDGYCYDLMERAGRLEGYAYDTAGDGDGEKRVRVKLEAVNDNALIHSANKATTESPA